MTLESKSTSSIKKKKSNNFDIYLASSSPRRTEILKDLKVNFEILKCDFDELNFTDAVSYTHLTLPTNREV